MQLIAVLIAVENPIDQKVYILTRYYELSKFGMFYKNTVKETFKFVCRESLPGLNRASRYTEYSNINKRHTVTHEENYCHIQVANTNEKVAAYLFCDLEYPRRVAFAFLNKALEYFNQTVGESWKKYQKDEMLEVHDINKIFNDYQDPKNVDKLYLAQIRVDETNVILHENIKQLLERQGDLDKLVAKSNDLSAGAKVFYKQSKDMNKKSCCTIM